MNRGLTKVNSLRPNAQLLIALHSLCALAETGLLMCLEKSRDSEPVPSGAVRSLQSGLMRNYRENWASLAYFEGEGGEIYLQGFEPWVQVLARTTV